MIEQLQLAQLIRQHGPALELLAAQRCRQAEDCVQEAFIELVRLRKAPDDPRAWLFRVVRNKAINAGKAEQARRRREAIWQQQRPGWFEPGEDRETGDQIQQALEQLDATDREIVVARVWGRLTLEEAARLVGQSVSNVHRRYRQALQQLKQVFESIDAGW